MPTKTKKATFSINVGVLASLDDVIAKGKSRSKNAFVEEAIKKELREIKRKERREGWIAAMKDPLFLEDIKEIEDHYRQADSEAMARID